jgi:hypothetical protein
MGWEAKDGAESVRGDGVMPSGRAKFGIDADPE